MKIELEGRGASLVGDRNPIAEAVALALAANGARVSWAAPDAAPIDILVVSCGLLPDGPADYDPDLVRVATAVGRRMAAQGGGRIVFLLSALGLVPMRRHPDYSAAMAGTVAAIRGLAMQVAPQVLANGVAVGLVGAQEGAVAGDPHMLSHVSVAQPGTPQDVANAALFLCDPRNSYMTGQVLAVDGGWTAGYGRNF
jgi:NAD(P)-dependent dehydrogenase (short-subunit alcohol dehydrogenase family)